MAHALRLATQLLGWTTTPLGLFYRRIKSRTGPAGAITPTAHKLARLIYTVLKHGSAYGPNRSPLPPPVSRPGKKRNSSVEPGCWASTWCRRPPPAELSNVFPAAEDSPIDPPPSTLNAPALAPTPSLDPGEATRIDQLNPSTNAESTCSPSQQLMGR